MKFFKGIIIFVLFILRLSLGYSRIEYSFSYDKLSFSDSSNKDFFRNYTIRYFNKVSNKQTNFFEYSFHNRSNSNNGSLLVAGFYRDLSDNLFTYNAFSFGSKTDYLPKYRIDSEFYYKIGKEKNILLNLGTTFLRYHNDYKDFSISYGIVFYQNRWNFTYKKINSNLKPGNTNSRTDIFSLGIGEEKKYWLYFTYNYGNSSYILNFYTNPSFFNEKFYYYQLNYRTWLRNYSGIIIEYNLLKLRSYRKNGIVLGIFYEY